MIMILLISDLPLRWLAGARRLPARAAERREVDGRPGPAMPFTGPRYQFELGDFEPMPKCQPLRLGEHGLYLSTLPQAASIAILQTNSSQTNILRVEIPGELHVLWGEILIESNP